MAERLAPTQKHQFTHGGRVIYEWDQTLTEINMYILIPPDMKAKEVFCDISKQHLKFGRKGNPPFLDVGCSTVNSTAVAGRSPCGCGVFLVNHRLLISQMDLNGPVKVSDCIWTLGAHHAVSAHRLWAAASTAGHDNDQQLPSMSYYMQCQAAAQVAVPAKTSLCGC